jgi:predicted MFS family arabinose efflux permease
VIGAPVISQLSEIIGWQLTFLTYILLLNVVSILLTKRFVPSSENPQRAQANLFSGFNTVVKTRSACACLIGAILGSASWQGIVFFSTSFYRSSFELPTSLAAYLLALLAIFFTVGSVLSGKITNKIGRRKLTILGLVFMGTFTVLFTNIPMLWVSFPIAALGSFFGGIRYAAANNLSLEQLPEFRGTMMSLNNASVNLGQTFGSMIGGYLLLWNNWNIVGASLGILGLIGSIIYYLFSVDPMR